MVQKKFLVIGIIILLVFAIGIYYYFPEKEGISIKPFSLQLNILVGGQVSSEILITNNEKTRQDFSVSLENLEEFGVIEEEFALESGESKILTISLKDSLQKVGIYPGKLVVKTDYLTKILPIIIGVKDKNRIFTINQNGAIGYSNVYPGGELGIDIEIFDMNGANLREIKIEYLIKNLDGELILSEQKDMTIYGSTSFTKVLVIPDSLAFGNYVFITLIDYKGIKSPAGYLFGVREKQNENLFNGKFFILVILVFLFGIFGMFFYFIKTRDDLMIKLKKQQSAELKRNLEFIKYSKAKLKKVKSVPKRKKKLRELEVAKEKVIKKIKLKQKRQRRVLKRLKKKGRKNEMTEKLKLWENQGYKMDDTEKEIKKISKIDMKGQVAEWKGQGYKVGFLNK